MTGASGAPPRPVTTTAGALWDELHAIHGVTIPERPTEEAYRAWAAANPQSALCLSGGGIRSAAFCLGVLQALARKGVLAQFHYLSSVSGGGFIAAWLDALILTQGGSVEAAQAILADPVSQPPVEHLRRFTNYLDPEPGIASTDTWADLILWVRNVLLNWLIFLPALALTTIAPLLYRDVASLLPLTGGYVALVAGITCLAASVYRACLMVPSHAPPPSPSLSARDPQRRREAARVASGIVAPGLAWAMLAPLVAAPLLQPGAERGALAALAVPAAAFAAFIGAYVAALVHSGRDLPRRALYARDLPWWLIASILAAALLGLGVRLSAGRTPEGLTVAGPLWVTLTQLAQSALFIGLRGSGFRSDLDREWLARLSAEKVIPALLWSLFAAICLFLPDLVFRHADRLTAWFTSLAGFATGPVAAFLGRSTKSLGATSLPGPNRLDLLIAAVTALFAVALFTLLAAGVGVALNGGGLSEPAPGHPFRPLCALALAVVLAILAWWLGTRINVNRFSMQAVYRNRLVRAFPGSARTTRHPDPFTGFDPGDNPRLSQLLPRTPRRLFPVVNVTLNLVAGHRPDWAERKAASFTMTPLACGSAALWRTEDSAALEAHGAYCATNAYAGSERQTGRDDTQQGITLGTAMTISGAAVSPNCGYYSSPATAFIMTLFDARLGAWLPNPACATAAELKQAKPPNAVITLGREMLGLTNDRHSAVYLSDGGHFDNLGLYEMLRRRCRYILVIDAGEDPNAAFADLGNALRKAAIDFSAEVDFDHVGIGTRDHPLDPPTASALGRIRYFDPEATGYLLYLKPSYWNNVPMDVRAYASAHAAFPHESTLDQWFTESQFESYRHLGEYLMDTVGEQQEHDLAAFFESVKPQTGHRTSSMGARERR